MYYKKTLVRLTVCAIIMALTVYASLTGHNVNASANTQIKLFSPFSFIKIEEDNSLGEEIIIDSIDKPQANENDHSSPEDSFIDNRILVYHSHTTEAYLESSENRYEKLATRSSNESITVKKAGEALCDAFARLGIDSTHDKTNNEASGYSYAYATSRETIKKNIEENGEYRLYIDLHRDAYAKNTIPTVEIDGKSVAKIMLVVGGKSVYADENYALAKKIANELNSIHPQLCEKVRYVPSSIYNQDISQSCILVEVGDNAVSIQEACNASEYVALAIAKVLNG